MPPEILTTCRLCELDVKCVDWELTSLNFKEGILGLKGEISPGSLSPSSSLVTVPETGNEALRRSRLAGVLENGAAFDKSLLPSSFDRSGVTLVSSSSSEPDALAV
jgi:hypothetical protein